MPRSALETPGLRALAGPRRTQQDDIHAPSMGRARFPPDPRDLKWHPGAQARDATLQFGLLDQIAILMGKQVALDLTSPYPSSR